MTKSNSNSAVYITRTITHAIFLVGKRNIENRLRAATHFSRFDLVDKFVYTISSISGNFIGLGQMPYNPFLINKLIANAAEDL